jgi:hypothetical protein
VVRTNDSSGKAQPRLSESRSPAHALRHDGFIGMSPTALSVLWLRFLRPNGTFPLRTHETAENGGAMKKYYAPVLFLVLVAAVLLIRTTRASADNGDDGSGPLAGTWVVNVTANPIFCATGRRLRPGRRPSSNWRRTPPVVPSPKPTRNSTSTAQDRHFISTEAMALALGNQSERTSRRPSGNCSLLLLATMWQMRAWTSK